MAITFLEKKERQKNLIFALIIVILATFIIVWSGFFREEKPVEEMIVLPPPKIEIDWQTLKNPKLEELQLPQEIPSFEEKAGRENPLIPY